LKNGGCLQKSPASPGKAGAYVVVKASREVIAW